MIKAFFKTPLSFFVLFIISICFLSITSVQAQVSSPKLANYFLSWTLTSSQVAELSKWDLLVLDMENQIKNPNLIKQIRKNNPDVIILAYITPQEIINSHNSSYSQLRRDLGSGIISEWYLRGGSGEILSYWPGTRMLNITSNCPKVGGKKLNDYMAEFVVNKILSTGLWDGVFYDNAWEEMSWAFGNNIDTNNDGKIDNNPNIAWQQGVKELYEKTRILAGSDIIVVGNASTNVYKDQLDGNMIESFSAAEWASKMNIYKNNQDSQNNFNIINVNTNNTGNNTDYQKMRFGLVSTLLEDGYYSFDYGNQDHGQTWWYDEYNIDLGEPLGSSVSQNNYNSYNSDVWTRSFSNGLSIVNSTAAKKVVDLGGEYEKIHGTQDPQVNDGSIVTETVVDGYDGLLLLKTFDSLQDVLFRNGDFVRFFDAQGERIRNGFFVFEEGYKGGDQIAHIDLDGNGRRDLLVVSKNKIMAWRDDGMIYAKIYPYTAMYRGDLKVAIGDLNKDGLMEIYVAPSAGYNYPIKIYTRHGRKMKQDWYPYGGSYAGGYSLSVLEENKSAVSRNSLLVGKASGEPLVSVFDYNYKLAYQWLAFDKFSNIGVNIATGDLNGDNVDEVVIGAGEGYDPVIRVFDKQGSQLYDEFTAYSSFSKPGIEVLTGDVDYDGKDDVIGMSGSF